MVGKNIDRLLVISLTLTVRVAAETQSPCHR